VSTEPVSRGAALRSTRIVHNLPLPAHASVCDAWSSVHWSTPAGIVVWPIFVPSVGHFRQGMLVSIPLHLDTLPGKPPGAALQAALETRYAGTDTIRVARPDPSGRLEPEALNGTNRLELFVHVNEAHRQAVLVARLDNLGKGASGAAVQNLCLMLGVGTEGVDG